MQQLAVKSLSIVFACFEKVFGKQILLQAAFLVVINAGVAIVARHVVSKSKFQRSLVTESAVLPQGKLPPRFVQLLLLLPLAIRPVGRLPPAQLAAEGLAAAVRSTLI